MMFEKSPICIHTKVWSADFQHVIISNKTLYFLIGQDTCDYHCYLMILSSNNLFVTQTLIYTRWMLELTVFLKFKRAEMKFIMKKK